LSDPRNPRKITEVDEVSVSAMKAVGSLLYVVGGGYLYILDITDPGGPRILSSTGTGGAALGVDVAGDYAYVAAGSLGLRIAYVADPEAPYFVGTASTTSARRVEVLSSYAYVADGRGGLRVIDVSMPTAPFTVMTVPTSSWVRDVALNDRLAIIAESDTGLRVFDILDPGHPSQIGAFGVYGPNRVRLAGSTAHMVANGTYYALDISDPTQPVLLGTLNLTATINGITDLAVEGGLAGLADDNFGFHVIDVSNGVAARSRYQIALPGTAWDIAAQGQLAFLACFARLCIVDVSDPSGMRVVGDLDVPDGVEKIAVSGNLVSLASRYSQLHTIDATDPTRPVLRSTLDLPSYANDVALRDGIAYVTGEDYESGTGILTIVDLREPSAPVILSVLTTPGPLHGVALQGPYAIVIDYETGVILVDIADPTAPILLGDSELIFGADVVAGGSFAYVAEWLFDLSVVDIRDPQHPEVVSELNEGFVGTSGIAVENGIAYLSRNLDDIEVVDVNDPLHPMVLGNIQAAGSSVKGVTIVGDWLFFLSSGQLECAPLQCVDEPTAIALSNLSGVAESMAIRLRWNVDNDARYLGFIVSRDDGAGSGPTALNERNPIGGGGPYEYLDEAIEPGASYEYEIAGLRLDGGTDTLGPLQVVAREAGRLMLYPPYPSPATASVNLPFALPAVTDVRVSVFDANGRMVRTWLLNDLRAGVNEATWNGRDDDGREVAAGIYVARVSTTEGERTARVVILK
jgi:hypothetical protein